MLTTAQHQAWLFYTPLAKQAALLKDDLLEAVDPLLDDPQMIDLVRSCLAGRRQGSARIGRPGISPDRLLRCCVLKHMKGWSFRGLERELRSLTGQCALIFQWGEWGGVDSSPPALPLIPGLLDPRGREVGWGNQFLDAQRLRQLSLRSLQRLCLRPCPTWARWFHQTGHSLTTIVCCEGTRRAAEK
jgi:hypothetical protein